MIYEVVWKAVWLIVVALPPFLAGEEIPRTVITTRTIIGICLLTILIPWKYVLQPIEPWKRKIQIDDEQ